MFGLTCGSTCGGNDPATDTVTIAMPPPVAEDADADKTEERDLQTDEEQERQAAEEQAAEAERLRLLEEEEAEAKRLREEQEAALRAEEERARVEAELAAEREREEAEAAKKEAEAAAEAARQTNVDMCLLSEELGETSLSSLSSLICDRIQERAEQGRSFGVVVVPDGLLLRVAEVRRLLNEIDHALRHGAEPENIENVLSPVAKALFASIPAMIQHQLISSRTLTGGVDFVGIETEKLIVALVEAELSRRKAMRQFDGSFQHTTHALTYQGRSAMPTNFDCDLGYTSGYLAATLTSQRHGYMVTVQDLGRPPEEWVLGGVPLTSMIEVAHEKGSIRPKTALAPGESFESCLPPIEERRFVSPGPIQFCEMRLKRVMSEDSLASTSTCQRPAHTSFLLDAARKRDERHELREISRLSELITRLAENAGSLSGLHVLQQTLQGARDVAKLHDTNAGGELAQARAAKQMVGVSLGELAKQMSPS